MNEEDINKKILELEKNIRRLDYILVKDKQDYLSNIETYKKSLDKANREVKQIVDDGKKEIVTFTFQLISTIIGFLSLTLAIVILWINKTEINTQMEYILLALGITFTCFFIFFVLSWRKIHFPKMEKTSHKKIVSYINSKHSDMVDYINDKISDVDDLIKSNNSDMSDYIGDKIGDCCEYTDGKISEVAKLIKGDKK